MSQPAIAVADVSPVKKYGMLAWTVAGLVIAAYWTALTDNRITLDEGLAIGVVFVQGVAIYIVPQTEVKATVRTVSGTISFLK